MITRKNIGNVCYAQLFSKAELVRIEDNLHIPLSLTEYKILSFFVDHMNVPISLEELAKHVWGIYAYEKDPNSLKSQISRLRSKMDNVSHGFGNCIETNYGLNSYTLKINGMNVNTQQDYSYDNQNIEADLKAKHDVSLQRVQTSERILLAEGVTLFGTDRIKCAYCILDNPLISRIHTAVHKSASQEIVVQDMNSSYGTFINGQRIPPMIEFPINDNDIISIADEDFICNHS